MNQSGGLDRSLELGRSADFSDHYRCRPSGLQLVRRKNIPARPASHWSYTSPTTAGADHQGCDWSVVRIYPRVLRPIGPRLLRPLQVQTIRVAIGPSKKYTRESCVRLVLDFSDHYRCGPSGFRFNTQ
eukprot:1188638-Prorocentrum_minimum.AAC.1